MIVNGTTYKNATPERVVELLEQCREDGRRIRVWYGDHDSGLSWGDEHVGYVSRSMGPNKIPILCHNKRSFGGCGILDDCIVRITLSRKPDENVLYQHRNFTRYPMAKVSKLIVSRKDQ